MKGFVRVTVLTAALAQLAGCAGLNRGVEEAQDWAAGIDVTQVSDGVSVRLPETVLFDSGHSDLRADAGPAIHRTVAILARSKRPLVVEGHTDNVGSIASNQALSEARARSVADALEHDGIPASRISVQGYSSSRPIADNDSEEGRAQNRRAEILIPGESVDTVLGGKSRQQAIEGDPELPSTQADNLPSPQQPTTSYPDRTAGDSASKFIWPVQRGNIAAPFVAGKTRGMLVAGEAGQPVRAVAAGRVMYSGTVVEAYGPLVIILHKDGYVTSYAHNGRLLVKDNQVVSRGQTIAEMGADKNGAGLLQFEIRRNSHQLDPLKYLAETGG